ncbi:hypothetical protein ASE95_04655 [Sphingomonas sp. Leaf231]|uniref:hypothetical protein n=1 Tax=Sphingomonas sp. Leaf231 TaxID=1736301 RepID=UPI0006FD25FC|nr:hypothetical protein [Sphingomonas sp. Leaf231]KQN94160.1 hypothetical protein ASE95_04655 [Sphingomonas sp. Leaf231]
MPRLRPVLIAIGALCALMGALWIAQGLGYVDWPRSSFMLGRAVWADYGTGLAVFGLLLILLGRRLR